MADRTGLVTVGGKPVTLTGDPITIGQQAPDCVAVDNDMAPIQLSSFKGKVVILSFVASLETSVCDTETRRFNQEAAGLGDDVAVVTVSMDLPFTQKRWCGAAGIDKVVTVSDFKERCLGNHFGIFVKETGLHARSVYVLDKQGVIQYEQIVPEVATEPDYEAVLEQAKKLI